MSAPSALPLLLSFALQNVAAEPATTPQPGFDCRRAASAVEHLICSDVELAASDRRVGLLFAEARRELGEQARPLIDEQRAWLKERDGYDSVASLHTLYVHRERALILALPTFAPGAAAVPDEKNYLRLFPAMSPDTLYDIATEVNRPSIEAASCSYFRQSPTAAVILFAAHFGSSLDAGQPLCRDIDITKSVPETKAFVDALDAASAPGRCYGTIMQATFRDHRLSRIMAVVDTAPPDLDTYADFRTARYEGMSYHPDLEHWAQQGSWEKTLFAEIQRTRAVAQEALRIDYAKRVHLDPKRAAKLAEYHVERLIESYTGDASPDPSALYYASRCLDRHDLDTYLADGKPPEKRCSYGEHDDASPSAELRRLLGLAIVNDYPLADIQRLITAGAALNPEKQEYSENSDSPLMLAAARADVIAALLAAGADPNPGNHFGKTALMYAIAARNDEGVRALLKAGANVDATTDALPPYCSDLKAGLRTPLMYAAWHGNVEIVKTLLDAHAQREAEDSNGEIAEDYLPKNTGIDAAQRSAIAALLHEAAPADRAARPNP